MRLCGASICSKRSQRGIDGQHVHAFVVECIQRLGFVDLERGLGVVQAQLLRAIAAALRTALPRVVDQHATHDLRGQRQELLAVLPVEHALPGEPDEGLVDQRRALQGVIAAFARHLAAREPAEVVVDQRPERIEGSAFAIGPALQQSGDLAGRLVVVLVIDVHAALWRRNGDIPRLSLRNEECPQFPFPRPADRRLWRLTVLVVPCAPLGPCLRVPSVA